MSLDGIEPLQELTSYIMSRGREKMRKDLLYDDPIDCGVFTFARNKHRQEEIRTISEIHRFPENLAVYGLFAGHGGTTAAELCARNFVPTLLEDSTLKLEPESAIRNTCKTLEAFVLAKSGLDKSYYGTTLLVALMKRDKLYVTNIGNSRAVIVTKDGVRIINEEHDDSNAEEVARIRNAGGFFQDGKVNNLIRVTRSIGDLELKERKHIMFPNRTMTEDIVIAIPDIYCRRVSPRDEYLIMATAEVWETLTTKGVVQFIKECLEKGETTRSCAKKVATAATASGAKGPVSVMILMFCNQRVMERPSVPPKRRSSRHHSMQRHSSNAEEELRSMKEKKAGTPAFVLRAQAEEVHRVAVEKGLSKASPIVSPVGTELKKYSRESVLISASSTKLQDSATLLPLDIAPSGDAPQQDVGSSTQRRINPPSNVMRQSKVKDSKERSVSALEAEVARRIAEDNTKSTSGRYDPYMDFGNAVVVEERTGYGKQLVVTGPRAKSTVASKISELTASGATGDGVFLDTVELDQEGQQYIDYSVSGPSKVRYNEDGTINNSRLGFLRDLGRTFVRRK